MNDISTVAGCVILFNPDENAWNNILSYVDFVTALIVIDNSTYTNTKLVAKLKTKKNIQYIKNPENLGVAKALNMSAEILLSSGFTWMLTMDQDSFIEKKFFNVVQPLLNDDKNIIIGASYNNIFYRPQQSNYIGFVEIGTIITSGNLLNINGWKSLNGFCDKLFIDEVDNEFCLRAIKRGYKIQSTDAIYLHHNLGTSYLKKNIITNSTLHFNKHSPFRLYYITRNVLFLCKNYSSTNTALVFNRLKNFVKLIFEITFYYPQKLRYYKYIIKGTFHFLSSKYGKL